MNSSPAGPREVTPAPGGTVADRVLGLVGAAMVIAALLLFVFGGPSDGDAAAGTPPGILLLSPDEGATVGTPLELTFSSSTRIGPSAGGWGVGEYHIHADVDGREIMPGPNDIRRLEAETYRWTIPGVSPGSRIVRLFWSDRSHRPLAETATPPILITIE